MSTLIGLQFVFNGECMRFAEKPGIGMGMRVRGIAAGVTRPQNSVWIVRQEQEYCDHQAFCIPMNRR